MNNSFFVISSALCVAEELKPAIDKMIENSTWKYPVFVRTEFAHCGDNVRVKFVYRSTTRQGPYDVVGGHSVTPALKRIEESDDGIVKVNVTFGTEFASRPEEESNDDEHNCCGKLYNTLTVYVDFAEEVTETAGKRKRTGSPDKEGLCEK